MVSRGFFLGVAGCYMIDLFNSQSGRNKQGGDIYVVEEYDHQDVQPAAMQESCEGGRFSKPIMLISGDTKLKMVIMSISKKKNQKRMMNSKSHSHKQNKQKKRCKN